MKNSKIIKGLLLVSVAALALVACGKKTTKKTNKTTKNNTVITTNSKTNKTTEKKVTTKKQTTTNEVLEDTYNKCFITENDYFIKIDVEDNILTNVIISSGFGYCLYLKPVVENNKYVALQAINPTNDEPGLNPYYTLIKKGDKGQEITLLTKSALSAFNDINFTSSSVEYPSNVCAKISDEKITLLMDEDIYEFNIDGSMDKSLQEITASSTNINADKISYENETLKLETFEYGDTEICLKKNEFKSSIMGFISQEMKIINNIITINYYYPDEDKNPINVLQEIYKLDDNKNVIEHSIYDNDTDNTSIETYTYNSSEKSALVVTNYKDKNGNIISGLESKQDIYFDDYDRVISRKVFYEDNGNKIISSSDDYTLDDFGRKIVKIIDNEKYIYEYENNRIKKLTYQKEKDNNFVTQSYSTYEYTNGKMTEAKFYEIDSNNSTETLTRRVYRIYENSVIKEYGNLEYDSTNYKSRTFKKIYSYDTNNKLSKYQLFMPTDDKSDLYKYLEENYTYSTENNYNITTKEEFRYNEAGEITARGLEVTKENANTKIWQEYHYNGENWNLNIEETTVDKGNGIYDRTKIYFNADGSKNYGETITYDIGDNPKSVLDEIWMYDTLQTKGVFFSYKDNEQVINSESFYGEYGYTYKKIQYKYKTDGSIKQITTTIVDPIDDYSSAKKIKEIVEYYYDSGIYEVSTREYYVAAEKEKSVEIIKYDSTTLELIESSIVNYSIDNDNNTHKNNEEVIIIDKDNHTKKTIEYTYKIYSDKVGDVVDIETITILDTTTNIEESRRFAYVYYKNDPYGNVKYVTELKFNSNIAKWQPYRDYGSTENLDDIWAEYFYENNILVRKENYDIGDDYAEIMTEHFNANGELIKRELTNKSCYSGIWEVYYSIDTNLYDEWDYDDFINIEQYYLINDEKIVYFKKTIDDYNNPLYYVGGYYDETDEEMDFVDVVIYNENGAIVSVTRYQNDYTNNKHSVYTLKNEKYASYNENNYQYNFDNLTNNFDAVENEQNLDGIILIENAPLQNN